MIPATIERSFTRIGARVKLQTTVGRWQRPVLGFGLDIATDRRGEYFALLAPSAASLEDLRAEVLDVRRDLRHLLLQVRQDGRKDKFLCGHDERHWFTCAVPGPSVSGVRAAMEALKPSDVRAAQASAALSARKALRRRNAAFVRQGEWFFVPTPELVVPATLIRRAEPLSRGNGRPHRLEEAYRTGGELVYVCWQHPAGVTEAEYRAILTGSPHARGWGWTRMLRDAAVYARGRVSHADHATIVLRDWHRVLMNTEREAPAARHVVFLD